MPETYLDLFNQASMIAPMGLITLFFLTLLRIAPIVALAPFLGAKVAPAIGKMGIAICLTAIFLPKVMTTSSANIDFNYLFAGYALKELLVGFIIGILVAIPFYIASSAGVYIDFQRGSSIMMVQDPSLQMQASPIGLLYNYTLIVLFFQIDGPFAVFDGILKSFEIIPPDHFIHRDFFSPSVPFWKTIIDLLNHIVSIALQLAAPSLLAILMAEMFLGIANRLAPQVQIAFLGMSLKSLLGIGLLWAAWFLILKQLSKQTLSWIGKIDVLLHNFMFLKS